MEENVNEVEVYKYGHIYAVKLPDNTFFKTGASLENKWFEGISEQSWSLIKKQGERHVELNGMLKKINFVIDKINEKRTDEKKVARLIESSVKHVEEVHTDNNAFNEYATHLIGKQDLLVKKAILDKEYFFITSIDRNDGDYERIGKSHYERKLEFTDYDVSPSQDMLSKFENIMRHIHHEDKKHNAINRVPSENIQTKKNKEDDKPSTIKVFINRPGENVQLVREFVNGSETIINIYFPEQENKKGFLKRLFNLR